MSAICGKTCSVTVGGSSYTAHAFTINYSGREQDVSSFGSSIYGDYIVCLIDAIATVQMYDRPSISPNDTLTFVANIASTPATVLTFSNSKVISTSDEVDAKGIVNHNVQIRLTSTPTVTS